MAPSATAVVNGDGGASARASPAPNSTSSANGSKPKAPVNSNGYHPPNPQVPLSSMRSQPLDLSSVERRGQPTASRETTKHTRPHGLQEAPTYRPTEEEWRDPFEYIRKIKPEAQEYGLCKIIPPDSWNPDFAIDTEKFHFRTRKQELNTVEGGTRANLSYLEALSKFHKQQGTNLNRLPYVDKKPLDLYKLKRAVESRGGFEKVCKTKKWAEIGRDLGYSGKIMSSLSTSLKNSYDRWLNPYENYLREAKPRVYQQLEQEYGGPLTPSPAPSPVKRSAANTPSNLRSDSPARHASDSLQASVADVKQEHDRDTAMADAPPATSGGFRAINSGGFTAVNSGFTSVNKSTPPPKNTDSSRSSAKHTPDGRSSTMGPTSSHKRQKSVEGSDSTKKEDSADKTDTDGGNRRSKRIKKEPVPTVAGSHMSVFRPSAPRAPREESTDSGEKCETCGKGEDAGYLAICESCDHLYHGFCLDPPLKSKPEGEWNCPRCLVGDGQFGFEEGGLYSLRSFQEKAADFKHAYFEKRMPFDPVLNCPRPVTEDDVEREFWKLVASIEETVEVEYGADIHCTTHGSGFPTAERNPTDPYSTDLWNLTVLPYHPDSLFRHIKTDISGMTVPWVYVGMIFSTFCWHNEDHLAYSANYQHFGATKTWYGIPAEDTAKFENAMREAVPELFETQPDLLFQLVTLLTPEQLKKAGVRVYAVDQRAGQFVVTFPEAYHAGFNHGFNFNEAVNFAPPEWEPYGFKGVDRLQQFRRLPCFSHDELLWTAAEAPITGLTIQTARWLAPALDRIREREFAQRDALLEKHLDQNHHPCKMRTNSADPCSLEVSVLDEDVSEDEYQCAFCKGCAYLSRFKCLESGKTLCLTHAGSYACCDLPERQRFEGQRHALIYRKTRDDLEEAHRKVAEKAQLPEAWEDKYEKMLDEGDKPALKSLRQILHEGERIPYDLPSLPALREFVDRCNEWVEEATNFTVRKQQNRRKNDKAWQPGTRKSIGNPSQDQKEREARSVDHIYRLIREAALIGFDCPEIQQLQDRADGIKSFQKNAEETLKHLGSQSTETIEELIDEGRLFNVDMPELDRLAGVLEQMRWTTKAKESRAKPMTLEEVGKLVEEGKRLEIAEYNDYMKYFKDKHTKGVNWEVKAREVMSADHTPYSQLEALSNQVTQLGLPVSADILASIDQALNKHRAAQRQVTDLVSRSKDGDYSRRPKYSEVVEVTKELDDLNSKPPGTLDLEKEQKRHEDWMRKGKKLFGKTNAPLHILKLHMDYVLDRNVDCFDTTTDKVRMPAEPSSRAASEEKEEEKPQRTWDDPAFREVFCICRRVEAGMMIECELCHEWYHGKCLKIARGKVKEDDKYTCPICDWRVRIPRDAARPKLEDLMAWQDEIADLPFQPDEEEVLQKIIDNAQDFRNHIAGYCNNPVLSTASEADTQRFYLRKVEGAEILLSFETNFFRQELHKWNPVAPDPPPVLDVSKSTRKPRPTKLQKMLAQNGVDKIDDLPEHLKGKALSLKRKAANAEAAAQAASLGPVPTLDTLGRPNASPTTRAFSPTNHPFQGRGSHPPTPTVGGSSHAHPARGSVSSSSSHRQESSMIRPDPMNVDEPSGLHPGFMLNSNGPGPQFASADSSISLEDRLLRGLDENLDLTSEAEKGKALEILGRTETGRERAKQIFGDKVWTGESRGLLARRPDLNDGEPEHPGRVDKMFLDLTNGTDDDEARREREREKHRIITADSLEAERDAMDMEDSD